MSGVKIFAIGIVHAGCSEETDLAKLLLGSDLGFVFVSGLRIPTRILLEESSWEIKVPDRENPLGK